MRRCVVQIAALLLLPVLIGTVDIHSVADAQPNGPRRVYLPLVHISGENVPSGTTRVSVASNGSQANSLSVWPKLSDDGRFVVFESLATNLVAGDTNRYNDIFVHDRDTHQTTRVSVTWNGSQATHDVLAPDISDDGRVIVFWSGADNLVPGDTNRTLDVFVHDRLTGQTTRASVASDGSQTNASSGNARISGDGNVVVFVSGANNLVVGDTNRIGDVFVHDRQTGQTARVSVASDGSQASYGGSFPSISDDGTVVAFSSQASNLVPGDTNNTYDVFVHDRQTGQTTRVSVASDGTEASSLANQLTISGDGRVVAFVSEASNLVAGDTNTYADVFVHDRQTGETTRVTDASDDSHANTLNGDISLSDDGRYVTFSSQANDLVPGDTNGGYDVFVHDRQTGQTTRVSVASDGSQAESGAWTPSISGDGRVVAFATPDRSLVASDTNRHYDVFVNDNIRWPE